MVEVRTPDLQHTLQGGSSGDPNSWLGYLDDDPQDKDDPQRILPLSGPPYGGNTSKVRHEGAVGIPASGRSNGGSEYRVGGDIFPTPPEHHCLVYCYSSNTGAT